MRVIVAPDCFTGTLTASQAAAAITEGWRRSAPHDELVEVPLSDGGPGFVEVLAGTAPGRTLLVPTTDPLGREVPAGILLVDEPAGLTAYLESAQACGLHLLDADAGDRDPTRTSTAGVGRLLIAARQAGARRIVVGLGGSGTNDAGAGMLAALGVGTEDRLGSGGLALGEVSAADLAELPEVIADWRRSGIDLVAATDVDSPLLGLQGATAVFGPQKGGTAEQLAELERSLGHFAHVVAKVCPPRTDLVSGSPLRPERSPGAGAAGGLGYGLLLLGARRASGVEQALAAVDFDAIAAGADLVVTGEGSFDWQSLQGKVVAGVAAAAQRHGTPVIVLAGQAKVGRREAMAAGISATYAVAERPDQVAGALADPSGTLSARAERVARTWSPNRSA